MDASRADRPFQGKIRVAARIIDLLSSGLYESPAACLKELVNNSFDADAQHVDIFVKPDANRIIIQDDGEGMSRAEFQAHFDRIAESHKRDENDHTKSGRPKIGKIGIGVIAANELCEKLEIYSTKKASTDLLHVTIDFEEMRKPVSQRKRKSGDIVKADYFGEILEAGSSEHYTHIFLTSVRGEARAILAGAEAARKGRGAATLYGFTPESVEQILKTAPNTWKDFDRYSETLLEVALNVPVPYFRGWLPNKLRTQVRIFEKRVRDLHFTVAYDGLELRKPIVFNPDPRAFVRRFSYSGRSVAADGYFYAQHGSIKPREIHGLLVRIRNAAVGGFDPSFWGFSASEYSLIQRWVSCEIWADDRLEEAMNIDRKTLRVTHPAYVELKHALHEALRSVFSVVRSRIYEASSSQRKGRIASHEFEVVRQLLQSATADLDPTASKQILAAWKTFSEPELRKTLLRKYSVAELYKIVLDAANQALTRRLRGDLLSRLTERLRRG